VSSCAKGLDFDWCKSPDVGLLRPDAVFFLDVSAEVAEQRGGYGSERYEKREFQVKVREQFQKVATRVPDSLWHVIDAAPALDSVTEAITGHLGSLLEADLPPPSWNLWQEDA
jgi:dTMP kinase